MVNYMCVSEIPYQFPASRFNLCTKRGRLHDISGHSADVINLESIKYQLGMRKVGKSGWQEEWMGVGAGLIRCMRVSGVCGCARGHAVAVPL